VIAGPTRLEHSRPEIKAPLTPPHSFKSSSVSPKIHAEVAEQLEMQEDDTAALLRHYLNLKPSLTDLYRSWSAADPVFAKRAPQFTGVRILSQDIWETLVSFICSSNNNIARITLMVRRLCENWGQYVGNVGEERFHDFPTAEALAADDGLEQKLRDLGFGYRAKYITETARIVAERGKSWLNGLRNPLSPAWTVGEQPVIGLSTPSKLADSDEVSPPSYAAAHEALLELAGVGPKVADCVCLFGLGWLEAVPVDTHVWQIAQRDYRFRGPGGAKTFNKALHDSVGDFFRELWGEQAGWAHSVLFTADLKSFSEQAAGKVVKTEVPLAGGKGDNALTLKEETVASTSASDNAENVIKSETREPVMAVLEEELYLSARTRKRRADIAEIFSPGTLGTARQIVPRTYRQKRQRRRP
jgi:N-glycosylase/DNA lyase